MKSKGLALILVSAILYCFPGYAQEEHDLDSMTMEEIRSYVKELESENQSLREQLETAGSVDRGAEQETKAITGSIVTDYVKDYIGFNLSSVGYTSMGGDRRDYYGNETLKLILVSPDGAFVDPDDEDQLQSYTVVSQTPAPGEEVICYYDDEENIVNINYNEVVLGLQKIGIAEEMPQITQISPSTDKEQQFVKDYVGRNLATCGYTALNGNRYDTYATSEQRVQLSITDESGAVVDPSSQEMLKHYIVTGQSPEANSQMKFAYSVDSDGEESITGQTVNNILLTARITQEGQELIDQKAAEEEELRASGALKELYEGNYKVGTDIDEGFYRFKQGADAVSLYIYPDEEAFNNDEGDWDYIYGEEDIAYYMLREGMYIKIKGSNVISIRSEIPSFEENEFELYDGVYRVGNDIPAGDYSLTQISESCNVYLYQSEADYEADEGEWDFLYGKGDEAFYSLQEGMLLRISDGAANARRK